MDTNSKSGKAGTGIDEQSLLAYLNGDMVPARRHELELLLQQDPFLSDALEGLAEVKDSSRLRFIADQLNLQLRKQLKDRKQERRSRRRPLQQQAWIYVVAVLLLLLISWLVMSAIFS